jgi:hypothetical protein
LLLLVFMWKAAETFKWQNTKITLLIVEWLKVVNNNDKHDDNIFYKGFGVANNL